MWPFTLGEHIEVEVFQIILIRKRITSKICWVLLFQWFISGEILIKFLQFLDETANRQINRQINAMFYVTFIVDVIMVWYGIESGPIKCKPLLKNQ